MFGERDGAVSLPVPVSGPGAELTGGNTGGRCETFGRDDGLGAFTSIGTTGIPSIGGIATKNDGDGDTSDPADLCTNKVTAMASTITCRADPISQYSHIYDEKITMN